MKAVHMYRKSGPDALVYEDAPQPRPGKGEVLVWVAAASVTPADLTWRTTWQTPTGQDRPLPVIPGHDFSSVVAELGADVSQDFLGEEVFGLTDFWRDGDEAEYTLALPTEFARKPRTLNFVQAAAVPLVGLTAWQALFDHADLKAGQTLFIQGAAGGVGSFAVQLGRWAGAHVIGAASAGQVDFLHGLGVNEVVDYTTTRFEEVVHHVDVVLDMVGGETTDRSIKVLKQGGTLVSVARQPSQEEATTYGVRADFFIVHPDSDELNRIGELFDRGQLKPVVEKVYPLAQAQQAYSLAWQGHNQGKVVLQVGEEKPFDKTIKPPDQ